MDKNLRAALERLRDELPSLMKQRNGWDTQCAFCEEEPARCTRQIVHAKDCTGEMLSAALVILDE